MSEFVPFPESDAIVSHADEWADIFIRPDQIAVVHLKPKSYSRITVNLIIDRVRSMQRTEKLLVLILAHPESSVNYGGIRSLFSKKSLTYSVAKAYVLYKPHHFILSKMCMAVFRPRTPIRFFRNRPEAETWLSSFTGYGI